MAAADLNQLDLVARDLEKRIAFYRKLGVPIGKDNIWRTKTGIHHVDIEMPGGLTLHMGSAELAKVYNRGFRKLTKGGGVVIGFAVSTRKDVEARYRVLTKAGHKGLQPPYDAFWGSRYAIVADPDGNHVGIMSPSDPKKRSPGPDL
jgi:uncharacterized glyoxalase superfamily protein PhnB